MHGKVSMIVLINSKLSNYVAKVPTCLLHFQKNLSTLWNSNRSEFPDQKTDGFGL